jgi:hypothetical protein
VGDLQVQYEPDRPLPLHRLVFLAEGDEVTIGRADIDSYAIFPPDGAELVRRLGAGATPRQVAAWYETEYGESADVAHIIAALDELDFIGTTDAPPAPVRWQRLGAAVFSPPAWLAYAVLVAWAAVAMIRRPDLLPTYHNLFFTPYFTIIELVLLVAAVPLIALHEAFHALAGRRLGLRSSLGFGHRLHFLVVETSLDGLVAVPRRQRYLPILAGVLIDLVALAVFTIAADLTRTPGGGLSPTGRVCLAIAYAVALRIAWQFFFYLRTDLYVLITTVWHCVDLHTTAKAILRNRLHRVFGDRIRAVDGSQWHPVDRRIGRWYSWLVVVGYAVSLAMWVLALVPAAVHIFGIVFARLGDAESPFWAVTDSVVFLFINVAQLVAVGWVAVRERRQRSATRFEHVIT